MTALYFAYGANMNLGEMDRRCPGAESLGPARLEGFRFLINERGVATIAGAPGRVVHGGLWNLTEEHFETLDRFEGVRHGHYARLLVDVRRDGAEPVRVQVYQDLRHAPGPPRPGYLERVIEGARQHGLPASYIDELDRWLDGSAPELRTRDTQ